MSMYCPICNNHHDHNIMEHIYRLEEQVEYLQEQVAKLKGEKLVPKG